MEYLVLVVLGVLVSGGLLYVAWKLVRRFDQVEPPPESDTTKTHTHDPSYDSTLEDSPFDNKLGMY